MFKVIELASEVLRAGYQCKRGRQRKAPMFLQFCPSEGWGGLHQTRLHAQEWRRRPLPRGGLSRAERCGPA